MRTCNRNQVTHAMEELADGDFRAGVFAADAAHVPASALFGEAVAHKEEINAKAKRSKPRRFGMKTAARSGTRTDYSSFSFTGSDCSMTGPDPTAKKVSRPKQIPRKFL